MFLLERHFRIHNLSVPQPLPFSHSRCKVLSLVKSFYDLNFILYYSFGHFWWDKTLKHFLFVFLHIFKSCRRYGRNFHRYPERPEAARRTPTHTHRSSQGMPCVSYTLGLDSLFHKLKAETPKRSKPSGTPRVSGSNSPDPDVRTQCALDTHTQVGEDIHTGRLSWLPCVSAPRAAQGGRLLLTTYCCSKILISEKVN